RHQQVHDDDVRPQLGGQPRGLRAVFCLADYLEAGIPPEVHAQPLAHDPVVVGQNNTYLLLVRVALFHVRTPIDSIDQACSSLFTPSSIARRMSSERPVVPRRTDSRLTYSRVVASVSPSSSAMSSVVLPTHRRVRTLRKY